MKSTLLAGGLVCLFSLAGCASDNIIARNVETAPGVNTFSTDDGNFIGSISMRRELTDLGSDKVQSCLASSVEQGKGSESAASSSEQPGNGISEVSGEPSTQRVTGWTTAAGHTLAYRLELQTIGHSNYYYYDQLGSALSRSNNPHDYSPIPAWKGDQDAAVYAALVKITDKVQGCLSGNSSSAGVQSAHSQPATAQDEKAGAAGDEPQVPTSEQEQNLQLPRSGQGSMSTGD